MSFNKIEIISINYFSYTCTYTTDLHATIHIRIPFRSYHRIMHHSQVKRNSLEIKLARLMLFCRLLVVIRFFAARS